MLKAFAEGKTASQLSDSVEQYNKFQEVFSSDKLVVSNYEGTIMRGIEKNLQLSDGTVINQTIDDVFKMHPAMKSSNGRYSIGGPDGDTALYTSIGDNALQTIVAETDKPLSQLIISTQEVKLNKVLDLTNSENLRILGIEQEKLLLPYPNNPNAYEIPQMLGNLAQKHGFTGIIARSAKEEGKNLIIFERSLK